MQQLKSDNKKLLIPAFLDQRLHSRCSMACSSTPFAELPLSLLAKGVTQESRPQNSCKLQPATLL